MFEHASRYFDIETAHFTTADGRVVAYKRRRFLPPASSMSVFAEVTVTEGDRLDLIAARTLGDPEQFWRVCDGNNAMKPEELTERPGRVLDIVLPQGGLAQ